jgi:hypothetical protein
MNTHPICRATAFGLVSALLGASLYAVPASAGKVRPPSASCAAWAGKYHGKVRDNQNLMRAPQNISISIDGAKMAGVLDGNDSPKIYIWSTSSNCNNGAIHLIFSDNSDGQGLLTLSIKSNYYWVRFSNVSEGSARNFEGYFPESAVEMTRSPVTH